MNRIILIGNGFDLAHGLPTSYRDFVDDYWNYVFNEIYSGYEQWQHQTYGTPPRLEPYEDSFVNFQIIARKAIQAEEALLPYEGQDPYSDLCRFIEEYNNSNFGTTISLKFKNPFFEHISNLRSLKNWVDIENEYYRLLKQLCNSKKIVYDEVEKLNCDLKELEKKLVAYLFTVQNEHINYDLKSSEIEKLLFEPFNVDDISVGGRGAFIQFIRSRIKSAENKATTRAKVKALLDKYEYSISLDWDGIQVSLKEIDESEIDEQAFKSLPTYLLLPEDILFLNFNYTQTASLYIPQKSKFREIHIHGELNNPKNSIIFGYGDEMDEDYKKIVNLNDNNYLENIKSICYLKTDNYRNLLAYLDSAPYQVVIMGHSCGNSDRTMLNTLFEHKNCLSIKPYYHLKDDGSDNYIGIVQNISRDFNDMTLMRDRVVNKTYCKPLVQRK